jgi:hypothetical protein
MSWNGYSKVHCKKNIMEFWILNFPKDLKIDVSQVVPFFNQPLVFTLKEVIVQQRSNTSF